MTEAGTNRPGAVDALTTLRAIVAALGERATPPWWRTQFLTDAGLRAVGRVFPRTAVAAAVRSASSAARSEHDRLVGGKRYHLFRLPSELENSIDLRLADPVCQAALAELLKSGIDTLLAELKGISTQNTAAAPPEGPVSVGDMDAIRHGRAVPDLAAHYLAAFSKGKRTFPYVAEREAKR
jgi:hypothetical protein